MTENTRLTENYLTGAARFKDGEIEEIVLFCLDPLTEEMEAAGFLWDDFIVTGTEAIALMKDGAKISARFADSNTLYALEISVREGKETIEVSDVGQPDKYRWMRNLTVPGGQSSKQ